MNEFRSFPQVGAKKNKSLKPTPGRIIPFSKSLITMVNKSLSRVVPPSKWPKRLINGGDPNHLLNGMILQVGFHGHLMGRFLSSAIRLLPGYLVGPLEIPRLWMQRWIAENFIGYP